MVIGVRSARRRSHVAPSGMTRPVALTFLAVLSTVAIPGDAIAQPGLPGSSGPVILERYTRDRWIHEGQHPGFVPYDTMRHVPSRVYWNLGLILLWSSPLIAMEPSSCSRKVCDLLLHMIDAVSEPRLNDAILMGAFARDPARWYDRVVERAEAGSRTARYAAELGDGIIAARVDVPRAIPEPGTPWQAWQRWLSYASTFSRDNDIALQLYSARTGRDIVGELVVAWRTAPEPARESYDHILQALGIVEPPPVTDLGETLLSGSDDDVRRAQPELMHRMMAASPADDATALLFLQPLLDSIATGGAFPWTSARSVGVETRTVGWVGPPARPGDEGVPFYVVDENLPPLLAATLPQPLERTTREAWDVQPPRTGGVLIERLWTRVMDEFVFVNWSWTMQRPVAEDERPQAFSGASTVTLMWTPDGWRVAQWITSVS